MPELALDDVERHALAGELERMGVAQLMRREPAPHTRPRGYPPKLVADSGAVPRPPARGAVDDAEQRPDRQLGPGGEPGAQLFPAPLVHADLAPAATLAEAHQQRAAALIEIVLGQRARLLHPQPGAPQPDNHPSQAPAVPVWVDAPRPRRTTEGWAVAPLIALASLAGWAASSPLPTEPCGDRRTDQRRHRREATPARHRREVQAPTNATYPSIAGPTPVEARSSGDWRQHRVPAEMRALEPGKKAPGTARGGEAGGAG
jgi:hypothetical protein